MLRHVVAWSMSGGADDQLGTILEELRRLPAEIDEILALNCGRVLNESDLDAVLCVDLEDAESLARYRSHPAHQPVLDRLRRTATKLVVADYEL